MSLIGATSTWTKKLRVAHEFDSPPAYELEDLTAMFRQIVDYDALTKREVREEESSVKRITVERNDNFGTELTLTSVRIGQSSRSVGRGKA